MKPIILLVEDDFEMLEYLAALLSDSYHIIKARHGKDALEKLEKEPVQLIVSDVMMPIIDGMELCRQIKSDISYSHIPVILLTAKNTIQSKVQGLELGADAYIEKPFSKEYLVAQIRSLLKNRQTILRYFNEHPLAHLQSVAQSQADKVFLGKLDEIIHKQLNYGNLDVESLAESLHMSRMTLYRKIKSLTEMTPMEFITISRLRKAAELLSTGSYKVYEVAYKMGFSSQSNFARMFVKQYAITPTEYIQSIQNQVGENRI